MGRRHTTGVSATIHSGSTCLLLTLALAASGCGSAETPAGPQAGSSASVAADTLRPDDVVREFLDAIRRGDDAKASQMLTEVARRETQKHELVVAPPGSDTAKFDVGETEVVAKDELAHVSSKWTDIGDDGQPHTDEIVWACEKTP